MTPPLNPFEAVYRQLLAAFGPQGWWPADTPFEVMVGAVLTQRTSWRNVEQAIARIKASGPFEPRALLALPAGALAELIRPAGFYRLKAQRLEAFLAYFVRRYGGDAGRMRARPASTLRAELLAVNGIGPETADCVLLYALGKPTFVVDAYTRRIFGRLKLVGADGDYHDLQARFMEALPEDAALYNEYHALIVALGKAACRPRPVCGRCPLQGMCPVGKGCAG